jgi:hypothetical protein
VLVLLLLWPVVALATPLTRQDLNGLQELFGFDRIPDAIADQLISTKLSDSPSSFRACVRPIMSSSVSLQLDESLTMAIPDHEAAVAWRQFGATAGGAKFIAWIREALLSLAKGQQPTGVEALQASLDEAEITEIRDFMSGPVGKSGPPRLLPMTGDDAAAIDAEVSKKCSQSNQIGK